MTNEISGSRLAECPALHKKRRIEPMDAWRISDWSIKPYSIFTEQTRQERKLLSRVLKGLCESIIVAEVGRTEHFKTGFAISHAAPGENWLMLSWWAYDNVLVQAMRMSTKDEPSTLLQAPAGFTYCVYELAIVHHEQTAWRDLVLAPQADVGAYSRTFLPDNFY